MKIVFFGTPHYVLPILRTLHKEFKEKHESPISAVVTQEPKPSGRKKLLKYSAIDQWAHEREKPKYFKAMDIVHEAVEADIGILAAYGEIVPMEVIDYFPYGILNIHPSLLPQFRGASPVQATLVTGQTQAGVSIIKMDEQLDHGPIVAQFKEGVKAEDTTESLRDRLFLRSAEVLTTLIPAYVKNKINIKKQDHTKATFTKQISKGNAYIEPKALDMILKGKNFSDNWEIPFINEYTQTYTAENLNNFIHAMYPWPVAWTKVKTSKDENEFKRLKLISSHFVEDKIVLDKVQLEGKNEVSWEQFNYAYPNRSFE